MKYRNEKGQFFKGCVGIRKGVKFTLAEREVARKGRIAYLKSIGYTPRQPWDHAWKRINDRIHRSNLKFKRTGRKDCYFGIKNLISKNELKKIWFRDKGWVLSSPSLDRKNPRKDYTFKNCQFIEIIENIRKIRHDPEKHRKNALKLWKNPEYREKMLRHLKKLNKRLKLERSKHENCITERTRLNC